ncbi:hypothetical protein VNO80_22989 [Phaseolus coccineus]|uniref:Uncharacterized protein n=1 Tax=Phaseolus coccineus TaxID=3886 RepID=A0AAN9M5Z8_PHACN
MSSTLNHVRRPQPYHATWVFIKCVFGDKDLDMQLSNPLHLRAVLEDKRFLESRIVFLHPSYQFSTESSYLPSVYSYVNISQLNGSNHVHSLNLRWREKELRSAANG